MATKTQRSNFINKIAPLIIKYAKQYNYKVASPIIAQACRESGYGLDTLSTKYYNYFGMKCGSSWTGGSVNLATNEEYSKGTLTPIRDNFRTYSSMEEGVEGYFKFISTNKYAKLKSATTPENYLVLIKEAGYATDSNYVQRTLDVLEFNNLSNWDKYMDAKVTSMIKSRDTIVNLAKSWIGKNETDGTHKEIIDIYNSYTPHPRGYILKYTDAWCAGTLSALAIKLGYTDIIPVECSCIQMINLAKSMGIWIETDSYVPIAGDIIMYDWQDSGVGDNVGTPDHVGIVETCDNNSITVIEGNKSNAVGRRTLAVNGKYIRGFIVPKYDSTVNNLVTQNTTTATTNKSNLDIAKEVISGKWGNGTDRKNKLTSAGYDYTTIQSLVNYISAGSKKVFTVTKKCASNLNIRAGAGVNYSVVGKIIDNTTKYDIAINKNGWGLIADGTGWINLQYTKRA